MILEDIFWTTSSCFSSVLEAVEKIAELYSKCVRTSEIYANLNRSVVSKLEGLQPLQRCIQPCLVKDKKTHL